MTPKDYAKAAEIVRARAGRSHPGNDALAMYDGFVELFTDDNPEFDIEQFETDCSVTEPVIDFNEKRFELACESLHSDYDDYIPSDKLK
jgi:hypothetical protein